MENAVTENERARLLRVSTEISAAHRRGACGGVAADSAATEASTPGIIVDDHSVRLHVPKTLEADDVALCEGILSRVLGFVDTELPCLSSSLFSSAALCDLHAGGALEFSANEPAINVRCDAHTPHDASRVASYSISPDDL